MPVERMIGPGRDHRADGYGAPWCEPCEADGFESTHYDYDCPRKYAWLTDQELRATYPFDPSEPRDSEELTCSDCGSSIGANDRCPECDEPEDLYWEGEWD